MTKIKQAKKVDKRLLSFAILYDQQSSKSKNQQLQMAMIDHQLKLLDKQINSINKKYVKNEIIICVGYQSDIVIRHIHENHSKKNIRVVENTNYFDSNSCESLRIIMNNISNNRIIIMDGSMSVPERVYSKLGVDGCHILVSKQKNESGNVGANISKEDKVEYLSYGGCQECKNILVLCNTRAISLMKRILSSGEYKNKFIFEILNDLISLKYVVKAIQVKEKINQISNMKFMKIRGKKYEIYNR